MRSLLQVAEKPRGQRGSIQLISSPGAGVSCQHGAQRGQGGSGLQSSGRQPRCSSLRGKSKGWAPGEAQGKTEKKTARRARREGNCTSVRRQASSFQRQRHHKPNVKGRWKISAELVLCCPPELDLLTERPPRAVPAPALPHEATQRCLPPAGSAAHPAVRLQSRCSSASTTGGGARSSEGPLRQHSAAASSYHDQMDAEITCMHLLPCS